jgi:hypothetical protein
MKPICHLVAAMPRWVLRGSFENACQDDPQKEEATGYVIPAKAGIQANSGRETNLDSRLRGNDESKENPAVKPHFHYL